MTQSDRAPSEVDSSPRRSFDSPWFWICLFSCAAAVALVVIGPKFEKREAQLEKKLYMREHLAQNHSQDAREAQRARDGNQVDSTSAVDQAAGDEELLKTTGPLIWILVAVGLGSWVMFLRSRALWRNRAMIAHARPTP